MSILFTIYFLDYLSRVFFKRTVIMFHLLLMVLRLLLLLLLQPLLLSLVWLQKSE